MSGSSAVQIWPSFAAHSGVSARAEGGAATEAGMDGNPFILSSRNERQDAKTPREGGRRERTLRRRDAEKSREGMASTNNSSCLLPHFAPPLLCASASPCTFPLLFLASWRLGVHHSPALNFLTCTGSAKRCDLVIIRTNPRVLVRCTSPPTSRNSWKRVSALISRSSFRCVMKKFSVFFSRSGLRLSMLCVE